MVMQQMPTEIKLQQTLHVINVSISNRISICEGSW